MTFGDVVLPIGGGGGLTELVAATSTCSTVAGPLVEVGFWTVSVAGPVSRRTGRSARGVVSRDDQIAIPLNATTRASPAATYTLVNDRCCETERRPADATTAARPTGSSLRSRTSRSMWSSQSPFHTS